MELITDFVTTVLESISSSVKHVFTINFEHASWVDKTGTNRSKHDLYGFSFRQCKFQ